MRSRKRLFAVLLAVLFGGLAAWLAYEAVRWPDVAALKEENPTRTAFIARYREHFRSHGGPALDWRWIPYEEISPSLKRTVLVAEDINFFYHRGFATDEMRTALRESWREGKPLRGASTITQQLAKNLWLSPSRSPWRKLKEALLVLHLEHHLKKRRIFEIYLNVVEFGPGIYGAEAAARRYFGVTAAELDSAQAAALAASLPKPATWHPGSTSPAYRRHVAKIARRTSKAADWLNRALASEP